MCYLRSEHSIDKEQCKAIFKIFLALIIILLLVLLFVTYVTKFNIFSLMPSSCFRLYIIRCFDLI